MKCAYICIGNSDDKLPQERWASFIADVDRAVRLTGDWKGGQIHGRWFSAPDAPWQNVAWCLQLPDNQLAVTALKDRLGQLVAEYGQDSIAWTVGETRPIGPLSIVHVSPGCACGINEAGLRYVDPLCRDGS